MIVEKMCPVFRHRISGLEIMHQKTDAMRLLSMVDIALIALREVEIDGEDKDEGSD